MTETPLADRIVLSDNDATIMPDLPLGWPFRVSRWPVTPQWDRRPTRTQRALAVVRLSTGLHIRLREDEDETFLLGRIIEPLGLAWAETEAHYQIACDALSDVECTNMGHDLARGVHPEVGV